MDKKHDSERVHVLFHNRAGEALLSLYREFKHSVASIDRQWDENVFQQQLGKYTVLLRHRLESIAIDLMNQLQTGDDRNKWSHTANGFIGEYMREFGLKVRTL